MKTMALRLASQRLINLLRNQLIPPVQPTDPPQFREEYDRFEKMTKVLPKRFELKWADRYPCLNDRTLDTGFDRHYVYHTAWAARLLSQTCPLEHVDISSYLYFATLVSAFVPVRFYDYRPAKVALDNLSTGSADLTALPFSDRSIQSLSCMHVVEHIGLGRYGDPLDPEGDQKAMAELGRVVAVQGNLFFVVPIGRSRICFNAHRIYSVEQILSAFGNLELKQLALIPENPSDGDLIIDPSDQLLASQEYGCGCFWFRRTR